MIEDDNAGFMQTGCITNFHDLAFACIGGSIGAGSIAGDAGNGICTCAGRKQAELIQTFGKIDITEVQLNQNRRIARGESRYH